MALRNVLIEEENYIGMDWEKRTIRFVTENQNQVMGTIRRLGKGNGINSVDAQEIYSELILSLYRKEDYNAEKAIVNGVQISLEAYVAHCIKNCVKRYVYAKEAENKKIVIRRENTEVDLLDFLSDDRAYAEYDEVIGEDLREALGRIEHKRNKYGLDIYTVIYIRILTAEKSADSYERILKALSIDRKRLQRLQREITKDPEVMEVLRLVATDDKAADKVGKMVYAARIIRETIEHF